MSRAHFDRLDADPIMPFILRQMLDQIPLPSLRCYTLMSSALLVSHMVYLHHLMQLNANNLSTDSNSTNRSESQNNQTLFYSHPKTFSWPYFQTLMTILLSQSLSRLMFVNTVYCSVVLLARKLQGFIFGDLRPVELQRVKDKFWNYVFYKFCFLFGVLGVENFQELSLWISWFFSIAFAQVFCQLIKDRFELVSMSISIPRQSLTRILYLLIGLLCFCLALFAICCLVGLKYGDVSIFFFMLAEISLLTLDTTYLLVKYTFLQQQQPISERRLYIFYYLEFTLDIVTLTVDILYHLQMLFYHQTFMSMSSLILFMQLKPLFNEVTQRIKRHKSYRLTMARMERKYPLLTRDDLEEKARKQPHVSSLEEICSICWEKFEKARCLPCGHLFHQNCLRSWLEQDATCPICRVSLQEETAQPAEHSRLWPAAVTLPRTAATTHDLPITADQRRGRNHLFRFDGHRYSSWLPSFSIVINHNFPFRFGRARLTGVQLTSMAQSVQQIFPQIPFEIILSDLQQTQSIDTTIENIVEQRIQFEPQQLQEEDEDEEEEEEEDEEVSEFGEPVDPISDGEETSRRDRLSSPLEIIEDNDEEFIWPLSPSLPFDHRKQLLVSHMRRQYLKHERRLQASTLHQ